MSSKDEKKPTAPFSTKKYAEIKNQKGIIQACDYVSKYFFPLENGQHAFFNQEDNAFMFFDINTIRSTFFVRMDEIISEWYFKECCLYSIANIPGGKYVTGTEERPKINIACDKEVEEEHVSSAIKYCEPTDEALIKKAQKKIAQLEKQNKEKDEEIKKLEEKLALFQKVSEICKIDEEVNISKRLFPVKKKDAKDSESEEESKKETRGRKKGVRDEICEDMDKLFFSM